MKKQTKLGELIGTPNQGSVKVVYKGHVYAASPLDVRQLQVLVARKYHSVDYSGRSREDYLNFSDRVAEVLGFKVYNQKGMYMLFRPVGTFVIESDEEDFDAGFFDAGGNMCIEMLMYANGMNNSIQ